MDTQNSLRDGLLTVVLPAYNEQDSVPLAADTICPLLEKEGIRHEILFVNDGSRDGTWKAIQAQTARHPQVRGVCFPATLVKRLPSLPVWPRPRATARWCWTATCSIRRKKL